MIITSYLFSYLLTILSRSYSCVWQCPWFHPQVEVQFFVLLYQEETLLSRHSIMKLRSFMLLALARCLQRNLFCLRKAYAGNACLVISKNTLLKLSTVCIPISRVAWLKVAFASPVKSLSMNVYCNSPILMPWPSKALSSLSFQTSHSSGDPPP